MDKQYRIGFDIGIGSVGYAILENDPVTEEPIKIIGLGVRTFSPNEVEKTGESTAKKRRETRGIRRRKRRKEFRFTRMKNLISNTFGKDIFKEIDLLNFGCKKNAIKPVDVYQLRAKALDEKLTDAELSKVILNILKRRGFKSNRKNNALNNGDGELLKSITENTKYLHEKGYRTVGEMLFKDEKFKIVSAGNIIYNIRNHSGNYLNCFYRDNLSEELRLILQSQQKFGNDKITENFIEKVMSIFEAQRNFDVGPGKGSPYSAQIEEGSCTFIKTEKRAPKASYTFELFSALSKINNLKIEGKELSKEQKALLFEAIKNKKELKFADVRKLLDIKDGQFFNLCSYHLTKKDNDLSQDEYIKKCESRIFVTMKCSYEIRKVLGIKSSFENRDLIEEVAFLLSHFKSDSTIDDYISNSKLLSQLSFEQKDAIKTLNFDKFGSLSIKAMKLIEPHLICGLRYDKACQSAGFNHSSFEHEKLKYLKGKDIDDRLADVTNNVVKRSINQTLRILNEIIKKYGSPQFISIELARELGRSKVDRNKIERDQKIRKNDNEKITERIIEEFNLTKPTSQDIIKLKLYEEQAGKCMYSGKTIDLERLFEPNYLQIDHILPISRTMNDSYNNKVLVIADENQNKGDRTPYEFFGSDEKRWNDFVARVSLLKNREKQRNLLKQTISADEQKNFISRNLNDTRYMSKLLLELFKDYLQMKPVKENDNGKRKVIYSINGAVTSYLRKCWGINKIRDDGDTHHAVDAAVIATVSDSTVQKITKFNKFKEKYTKHNEMFINKTTGEVLTKEEKEELDQQNINILSSKLPQPYKWFLRELEIRSGAKYYDFEYSEYEKFELTQMGYSVEELNSVKPIFVSRMKNVKTTGPIHAETLMSTREYKETTNLIKSVSIYNLTVSKKEELIQLKDDKYPNYRIENYYRPQDDRLLYLKLKEFLVENGNKIPETLVFHKPRKDGSTGPIVRTIKMYQKATKCVITPNGAAMNDTMHRIDVFEKNGKFYICPIYMADVYAHKLPNKVIEIGKDWQTIDDTFKFKFSLYKNDLVKVISKKHIVMNKNFKNSKSKKPDKIESREFLGYYISTGISTASIKVITHDNCYKIDSLGVKTLLNLEKYHVDIMGNVYKAPKEERKPI